MRSTRLVRSEMGLPLYSTSLTTSVSDVVMQPALVVAIPCTSTIHLRATWSTADQLSPSYSEGTTEQR